MKLDRCNGTYRSDKKSVIFKKLDKVGEPYSYNYYGDNRLVMMQEYNLYNLDDVINEDETIMYLTNYENKRIAIEVKQNKKSMEENKVPLPKKNKEPLPKEDKEPLPKEDKEDNPLMKAVYAYVNGKISDNELIKSIKEMSDGYPYDKNNLKPFSLEAAKSGKPVCTRDGRKARIISFNRDFLFKGRNYCIVALINDGPHNETVYSYTEDGLYNQNEIHDNDLMMLPEKRSGWLVVRKNAELYNSKEAAICMNDSYIPVKVEFEI